MDGATLSPVVAVACRLSLVACVAYPWTPVSHIAKEGSMIICTKQTCEMSPWLKPDGRASRATKATEATEATVATVATVATGASGGEMTPNCLMCAPVTLLLQLPLLAFHSMIQIRCLRAKMFRRWRSNVAAIASSSTTGLHSRANSSTLAGVVLTATAGSQSASCRFRRLAALAPDGALEVVPVPPLSLTAGFCGRHRTSKCTRS